MGAMLPYWKTDNKMRECNTITSETLIKQRKLCCQIQLFELHFKSETKDQKG